MEKFISYAQDLEDWNLFCALADVQKGFYVDVGANDPVIMSVTKAFYERGWRGINIEPLETEYNKLCRDRPLDVNLNVGAARENGEMEFGYPARAQRATRILSRKNKAIIKS